MNEILETINNWLQAYNEYIGGYAILILLVPAGIFFTFYLRFIQLTKFGHTIKIVSGKYTSTKCKGDISSFKALTTALSATVGTGNIVGVALAIHYGGPGAVFWLWVVGFFGMAIKLVECTLSQKYKITNADGSVSGGPMYYIQHGLKQKLGKFAKILAYIFAFATILCSFGTGNMAQVNSISGALNSSYGVPTIISALIITALMLLIIVGGLKRIAEVTSKLVPFMAIFYFLAAILVLAGSFYAIPDAFKLIVKSAFTGTAATGGFIGSTIIMTMVWGVKRGLFSNEAGQGSAPIAHAAAKTDFPIQEGLVATLEPLVDTIIICTLTALVIIVTGSWTSETAQGVEITILGFEMGLAKLGLAFIAKHIVAIGLLLFAFSTAISWSYYGSRGVQFIFGDKAIKPYYYIYGLVAFCGSIWGLDLVWNFVDASISLMTIPNIIAILLLAPVVKRESKIYFDYVKNRKYEK
ncbi:sodium:alanine symporter family protein [Bacteroidales bacterium OttesenSCG-928-I21]|nr:sodium:alanine symporter family protein [Bacteroidales bacterium OttesenSCG-928-I21]